MIADITCTCTRTHKHAVDTVTVNKNHNIIAHAYMHHSHIKIQLYIIIERGATYTKQNYIIIHSEPSMVISTVRNTKNIKVHVGIVIHNIMCSQG